MDGWVGVDLDGTLARYDAWEGPMVIGAPIAPMVERVKRWLDEGVEVRIFTARFSGFATKQEELAVVAAIQEWCLEHVGQALPVTNVKDYAMAELWDDRAVQVVKNEGHPVGESTRGLR